MNRSSVAVARRICNVMLQQDRTVIQIPREEFKQLAGRSVLRKSFEQEVLGQLAELGHIAVFGDSVVLVSRDELHSDLLLTQGSLQFRRRPRFRKPKAKVAAE